MGREGVFSFIMEAKTYLPMLDDLRRIIVIAMKI
jgi:hypothetical protein